MSHVFRVLCHVCKSGGLRNWFLVSSSMLLFVFFYCCLAFNNGLISFNHFRFKWCGFSSHINTSRSANTLALQKRSLWFLAGILFEVEVESGEQYIRCANTFFNRFYFVFNDMTHNEPAKYIPFKREKETTKLESENKNHKNEMANGAGAWKQRDYRLLGFSQNDQKEWKGTPTTAKPSNSNSETIYEGCFIATLFSNPSTHFQM